MTKPDNDSLQSAAEVCEDYANYLRETEPYATNSISWLKNAANELYAAADDSLDGEFEDGDEPVTGGDGD